MNVNENPDHYEKWKLLIDQQEKSGQLQTEFCKQHGISVAQLGYYRGLLKTKKQSTVKNPPLFSPVKIKNPETKKAEEIKIALPNGFHCYFPPTIEVIQIKKLIEVLLAC